MTRKRPKTARKTRRRNRKTITPKDIRRAGRDQSFLSRFWKRQMFRLAKQRHHEFQLALCRENKKYRYNPQWPVSVLVWLN